MFSFLFFFRCGLLVLLLRPFSTFWYYTNTTFNRNIMRRKEEEKKERGEVADGQQHFLLVLFSFPFWLYTAVWDYGTMGRRPQVPDQFNFMHILLFSSSSSFALLSRCVLFSLDDDDDESSPFFSSSLCGLRSSNHRWDGHSSTGSIVILMLICTNLFREESFSPFCF